MVKHPQESICDSVQSLVRPGIFRSAHRYFQVLRRLMASGRLAVLMFLGQYGVNESVHDYEAGHGDAATTESGL